MKHAILLVAFGASSPQGQNALKGFDALVRQRYPGVTVRWAYTSVLLREVDPPVAGHVLDLGCGVGTIAVGLALDHGVETGADGLLDQRHIGGAASEAARQRRGR